MSKSIHALLRREELRDLCAGDRVTLSGVIYTGRDAAHKRLCALVDEGKPLPFDLRNQVIYYAGSCPAKPGNPIGSCGPTTSYRMDAYASKLCDLGLIGMIGNGQRSEAVIEASPHRRRVLRGDWRRWRADCRLCQIRGGDRL